MKRNLLLSILLLCTFVAKSNASPVIDVASVHPTTYIQMVKELRADEEHSALVKISTIGYSAKFKRPIVMVRLGQYQPATVRIMVLCRQHGDEPAGTEAAINFVKTISGRPDSQKLLKNVCLYIVPMVNPDGAEAETRLNGKQADLNRDWGTFHQSETLAVKRAVEVTRPQFILDIHSWDMIDPFQQICIEGPRGSQVAPGLLRAVADLQARAAYGLSALSSQTVSATTYGKFSDCTLAHRYFLKTDHVASLLFETGPGPNYGASLATRTKLVETLLNWLLRDTNIHADSWQRLASAEPRWQVVPSAISARRSSVKLSSSVSVSKRYPVSRWIFFGVACLILLWIAICGRSGQTESPRLPARYRRLLHTSHAYTNWHQAEILKEHNRYGSVWMEHVYESLFRHIISIGTRYRILKVTEQ